MAAVSLLGVTVLLVIGATGAAVVLGSALIALCAVQTAVYFCVPSALLALWDRLRRGGRGERFAMTVLEVPQPVEPPTPAVPDAPTAPTEPSDPSQPIAPPEPDQVPEPDPERDVPIDPPPPPQTE